MSNVMKPEPIGYFACNPETLKPEWGEDCVCQDNIYEPDETGTVGRPFVFADQSEAYTNALAAEGIRNALKIAAAIATSKTRIGALRSVEASVAAKTAQEIETQILALIIE